MTAARSLGPDDLCTCCDAECFDFQTTAEVERLTRVVGQERAIEAVRFGIGIRRRGFNMYALGPAGSGKATTIRDFLSRHARAQPTPDGWCYVFNFEDPHCPHVLRLPPGRGSALRDDMEKLVEELQIALPAAFEAEVYSERRAAMVEQFEARSREVIGAVGEEATKRGLALMRGPEGWMLLPASGGAGMAPDEFHALPDEKKAQFRQDIDAMEPDVEGATRAMLQLEREARDALQALDREVAAAEVSSRLDLLRERFADLSDVLTHFDAVQADMVERVDTFRPTDEDGAEDGPERLAAMMRRRQDPAAPMVRYLVNVLVDHKIDSGAPVVIESHPTLANLVGRIEYQQRYGALVTDFTLITPGALHRANGGYLVLEADEVLSKPNSWEALKRALRNERIRIEPPGDGESPLTTVSLEPAAIALDCKVILIGPSHLYYLLHEADADFAELFKVQAEFGYTMPRSEETSRQYARFIATVAQKEGLLPFHREAVARVVDYSSRLAGDSKRLSTSMLDVTDLLRESDFWAREAESEVIEKAHVVRAIEARIRRADRARERAYDNYDRDVVLLATAGEEVGQVNALTVVARGHFAFGMPVRVSARCRLGGGSVIDIEREVELGGPLHSKGVLILSGFVNGRYLPEEPLAMSASLTFEQSYSEVDGDSASSAELYALLSSLAELPIRQGLAVTGSVNQVGQVQAIGGVNEKIEGFFDICRQSELTGDQGVLIPAANVQHLMLRQDVVDAVAAGQFHVYPVGHIDEGLAILTGLPAGERGSDGQYPPDTVNGLVEDRLADLADKQRSLAHSPEGAEDGPAAD